MSSGGDADLLGNDPEVADLVRALRGYGVLSRADLLERSGARNWPVEGFNAALWRGVEGGVIRELGGGLYEAGPDAPDVDEGRFDPA
jgi:hypothetical protein